jgi:inner membrane protein
LGGLLGEVILGKQLGKRAIVLGAIAQSIPDVDIVASLWLDVPHDLLGHRGFTHSFLFVAIVSPIFAASALRWIKNADATFKQWLFFFSIQLIIHILLDSLNAYGTGWLEPFSHERFSFNVIFVADPFYSIWLIIAFIILLVLRRTHKYRISFAVVGLILSSGYLLYASTNKYNIDRDASMALINQHISHSRYFTTPTPLNTLLWMIVAEDHNGYQIGYRSVFDRKDYVEFNYFTRNDSLLKSIDTQEDVKLLVRFSQGYYVAEQRKDTLLFNDLRFGQQHGWDDPEAKFVFQYYFNSVEANKFAVQRGRFAGWNKEQVSAMYQRIKGN